MYLLHVVYDAQTGQQLPWPPLTYTEIGKRVERSATAVRAAEQEERLLAGRYRIYPDPIWDEWDKARKKILREFARGKVGAYRIG